MIRQVVLKRGKDRRLRQGHLLVLNKETETDTREFEPGSLVDVLDANGTFLGRGYINPHSHIVVRILTKRIQEIDSRFFKRRFDAALNYRKTIFPERNTFRLVHGVGDFVPGLIVDKYDDHIVVQANTVGIDKMLPVIVKSLDELLRPSVIIARNDSRARESEGLPCEKRILKGKPNPNLVAEVGKLKFEVDTLDGQKTGLFLDQGENYLRLEEFARSARTLDCFCYAGGWGLHAAFFGAKEVLGIDSSPAALERARSNARLNGLKDCSYREANVFELLKSFEQTRERFDLIILDPPAYVKSRNTLPEGLKAYRQVNLGAMKILNPNGILISCSCSYQVTKDIFLGMLRRASSFAGRPFRILEMRTQSRDHPVLLSIKETEYLKCAVLSVA